MNSEQQPLKPYARVQELATKLTDDEFLVQVMKKHRPSATTLRPALSVKRVYDYLGGSEGWTKEQLEEIFCMEIGLLRCW